MLTKRTLLRAAAATSLAAAAAPAARPARAQSGRPGFFKSRDIAEAGLIYGLPIVMNYAVMYDFVIDTASPQYKAPLNTIYNEARVFTYKDTTVPTPNSDTPYSMLWLDLRAEPIVISVPAVDPKRYYSVQLCDGNTYNYGYIGSRATGSDAADYMVAGPHWSGPTPPGIKKVFRATTQFGLTIFRTQLFNADDMDNVKAVQAGYKAKPLSAYLGQPAPPPAPAIAWPRIDKESAKRNFFEYLDFALQFAPALPDEVWIREQLARIGVGAGKSFNFADLGLEEKAEIGWGLKRGSDAVDDAAATIGKAIHGWRVGAAQGDAAYFHGDWLLRAAGAKLGIYGNNPEEACYPVTRKDVNGDTIDTSQYNYTLTFAPGQLPPVNAFWSITMYDSKNQLLVQNPIGRYLINSPMLPDMKQNADGSLTIYIQHASPGADKQSNWLPAPDAPAYLALRLYWPKAGGLSILPPGEGTWQPPGVVRAA